MSERQDDEQVDGLIRRFFAFFDNRSGRVPELAEMTGLFAAKAIVARYRDGACELQTPLEFAQPRVALLGSRELVEFHEWEESSSTRVVNGIATRTSRYAKSGTLDGAPYAGGGTKFFQLARFGSEWKIVALTWTDDA